MKKCFKCGIEKDLSEFYTHPNMADGHFNKCKNCAKKDVAQKSKENMGDPIFLDKERRRGREKYHRLYSGEYKTSPQTTKNWIAKYPEKRKAQIAAQYLTIEGKENHHWSYLSQHWKDILHLTVKEHNKAHRFLVYDPERFMYRKFDTNELLDTKEKHEQFIRWCINNKED